MYSPESRSSFPGSPPVGQHPYSKLFVFFADAAAARIAQAAASVHLSERQPATGCDSGIQHHRRTFRRERRETDVASTYQRHSAGTDLRAGGRLRRPAAFLDPVPALLHPAFAPVPSACAQCTSPPSVPEYDAALSSVAGHDRYHQRSL
ncbi:Uncharacterised protein [Shigella sonnei]|nr:Uncharacterised protein [Shigella sonnei]